jgi:phage-related protein
VATPTVTVRFLADLKKLSEGFQQAGNNPALTSFRDKFRNLGRVAAAGLAAAGVAIGAWIGSTLGDLARIETIGAQTDAVIRSTEGAAGRTREQIDELAGAIERMSGVEAESITEGQNLLLTFTNIQGANFDRATQAMTDMGVALNNGSIAGLDFQSAATLVGKALNDPIAGLSALSRVGVQFTDAQKDQIEAMVAAGDTAGAQAAILAELERQYGGSAAAAGDTAAGKWARIQNAFGEVSEKILSKLLPALSSLGDWLLTTGVPKMEEFGNWIAEHVAPKVEQLAAWIRDDVVPALADFGDRLAQVGAWIVDNRAWLEPLVVGILAMVVAWQAYVRIMALWKAIQLASIVVQLAWNAALAANPIGIIILAVVGLVAALVYLWNTNEGFRNAILTAWAAIKAFFVGIGQWWTGTLVPWFKNAWTSITGFFTDAGDTVTEKWNGIRKWFRELPDKIKATFSNSLSTLKAAGRSLLIGFRDGATERWTTFLTWLRERPAAIAARFANTIGTLLSAGRNLFIGFKNGATERWTNFTTWVRELPGRVKGVFANAKSWLFNAGWNIISGLWEGLVSRWSAVTEWVGGLGTWIANNKGPEAYDRALLKPNGRWIISGLLTSFREQLPEIRRSLTAIGDEISGTTFGSPTGTLAVAAPAAASAPTTINVYALMDGPDVGRRVQAALNDWAAINGATR